MLIVIKLNNFGSYILFTVGTSSSILRASGKKYKEGRLKAAPAFMKQQSLDHVLVISIVVLKLKANIRLVIIIVESTENIG